MKKIALLALFISINLNAELSIEQIDNMVNKIQQKRISKRNIDYRNVPSPFILIKKDENDKKAVVSSLTKELSLKLNAIINDTAFINGRWYKVGESVNDYNITKIDDRKVELKKGKNTMELFLPKGSIDIPQIKINEG